MKIANNRWPLIAVPLLYVLLLCGPAIMAGNGTVLGSRQADLFSQFTGQREFGFGELGRGHLPLWNPHIFSGIPALGNIQQALCYPPNLIFLLVPLAAAFNISIMFHLALGGFFMGAWARSLGLALLPSLTAGILYLGGGAYYSRVLAGHQTMICLLAWVPLFFWSVDAVARDGRLGPAIAGAAAAAMMLLAGYPQIVFHIGLAATLYALVRLAGANGRLRKLLLLALIPLLAAGVAAFQLAATVQAKAGTQREGLLPYELASSYSLPPENLLTLLTPFAMGGVGGEGYWGRWLLWETQLFFGITGLVMALAALGRRGDRDRWSICGLTVLMLVLALGDATPLFRVLYEHAPLFGHFRGHSKWLLPAGLFLVLLAARGFQSFLAEPTQFRALPGILLAAAGGVGAAAMVLGWGAGLMPTPGWWYLFLHAIGRTMESSTLTPDLLRQDGFLRASLGGSAVAFAIAAATLLLLVLLIHATRRRPKLAAAVLTLALLEVYFFDRAYLATFPIEDARRADVAEVLKRDPGDYRIHVIDVPDSAMSTGASDMWGYDPFVPRRYSEFMAFCQGVPLDTPAAEIPIRGWDPLLALLRVRYFFAHAAGGGPAVEGPFPHLPRAVLVPEYQVVDGPRERILAAMRERDFDPYRTAIVEEAPAIPSGAQPPGAAGRETISVRVLSTDELLVEAQTSRPALLLLSDPYFPGWRADSLPGSDQDGYRILRADYILQAIPLGPGGHRISVRYAPSGLAVGGVVSACTILGMVCAGLILWRRRREQDA